MIALAKESKISLVMANFIIAYQLYYQQNPRSIYLQCSSEEVPCPEALGYTQGKTLGSGTYAKVKAAWSPYEQKMIAIKNLHKKAASKDYLSKFLPREIEVLQMIQHPNILQIYQVIETEDKCYFMLEIAENGDLLDYINARGRVPEDESRYITKQVVSAVDYCHSLNIVHRDLKCENIMVNRDMQVKVGDFGFAVHTADLVSTPCGSYSYAAPELLTTERNGYDGKKADVWSLGVIIYAMVCGRLPFGDDSQVKKGTKERVLTFSRNISTDGRNLLRHTLNPSAEERYTCPEILVHPWISLKTRSPALLRTTPRYTLENCLPMIVYQQVPMPLPPSPPPQRIEPTPRPTLGPIAPRPQSRSYAGPSNPRNIHKDAHPISKTVPPTVMPPSTRSGKQHKQIVARIGAAGKRFAEAMRHVGHKDTTKKT